ncbi:FAS1 domain-containing protein [Saccharata proteae CBS 121410]|uniref:FAS1 domain-containing protein n=1 Tax=Saccharata proteae CBS 121410 TaxID=1314787 RepID=A0A9P4LVQ6_9PEZI|nr:FAS1 domain-containing protein [Saccharata proteae CBS 121410]
MKFAALLPLAALTSALVIPDEHAWADVQVEHHHADPLGLRLPAHPLQDIKDRLTRTKDAVDNAFHDVVDASRNALDDALARASDAGDALNDRIHGAAFDAESWLHNSLPRPHIPLHDLEGEHPPPPPHHGPHHHHKPNLTIYEMIAESKYTTKLAKLISEDDELVQLLNGTAANYTVFAPTDKAFEKIPKHHPKPSKEFIKRLLTYHVSADFYPAGRVLSTHTIPSLLKESSLGDEPMPQRLSVNLGLRGLTLNFYARIVAIDIFATNGVIHGLDSLLLPPPPVLKVIDLLPSEFSTLELGLAKTGLLDTLNTTDHAGGTFFAPSNFAFQKLGPRINAFLFSPSGIKYLKALLEYHVVVDQTLYSDAFYRGSEQKRTDSGYFHVDLPTLLDDRSLSVDVAKYGPFISIKINGFSRVVVQDGIAKDGVIQVVGNVLVPPKKLSMREEVTMWMGEEMSVEEFKERLEPFKKKMGSSLG